MTPTSAYSYPSRMGEIFILAIEEILGHPEQQRILTLAGITNDASVPSPISFYQIGQLQEAIFGVYGSLAGRGICRRMGAASFKYALKAFEEELGLNTSSFRLMPMRPRLEAGLDGFARLFNAFLDQHVRLERKEETIYWHLESCPLCWGRQVGKNTESGSLSGPTCDWAVGFLQEALYWLSGGKCFRLEEEKCLANGDSACTIGIDLRPMS